VADYLWSTQSPLAKALVPGRQGAQSGQAGIALSEVSDFSLVQVMARRGRWAKTAKAARAHYGVAAPDRPGATFGKAATLVWSGPDQFFALTAGSGPAAPLAPLRDVFGANASLSDQSGGRCHIRISGPRARDALAKVSSLDLHDTVFPVGAAAATSIDHTGVNLWRSADAPDGSPVYSLLVFTSFADSLWHTIVDAAAEYGVDAARAPAFA
jgi:heterotetrameric sarcosine oxidase gamma subunit